MNLVMPLKAAVAAILLLAFGVTERRLSEVRRCCLPVGPEARLDPRQITLNFRVSANGDTDVTSQVTNVLAWVRTLPVQQIRVTAQFVSFHGPGGPMPAVAVRWAGSKVRATAGGHVATCSSGTFEPGAIQDLVLGWQRSGILACAVKFELTAPRNLSPGPYSGTVNLALDTH
jgi:hypothetical protein